MAVDVPGRNPDQVKVTGAELDKVVETRENMDGGPNDADHVGMDTARVHDHGISDRDHENQSTQRVLRQDVKKAGGDPGLVFEGKPFRGTFVSAVGRQSGPVARIVRDAAHPDPIPAGPPWAPAMLWLDGTGRFVSGAGYHRGSTGTTGIDGVEQYPIVSYQWAPVGPFPFVLVTGTPAWPIIRIAHFASPPGSWTIRLTVTDASGKTGSALHTIVTI